MFLIDKVRYEKCYSPKIAKYHLLQVMDPEDDPSDSFNDEKEGGNDHDEDFRNFIIRSGLHLKAEIEEVCG